MAVLLQAFRAVYLLLEDYSFLTITLGGEEVALLQLTARYNRSVFQIIMTVSASSAEQPFFRETLSLVNKCVCTVNRMSRGMVVLPYLKWSE